MHGTVQLPPEQGNAGDGGYVGSLNAHRDRWCVYLKMVVVSTFSSE